MGFLKREWSQLGDAVGRQRSCAALPPPQESAGSLNSSEAWCATESRWHKPDAPGLEAMERNLATCLGIVLALSGCAADYLNH